MTPAPDLEEVAVSWAARLVARGPHRALRPDELVRVPALVAELRASGEAPAGSAAWGLAVVAVAGWTVLASDPESERSWLLLARRPDDPVDLLVQVPHPASDRHTEAIGAALAESLRGAMLLQACAHRRAGRQGGRDGTGRPEHAADVAHRPHSLFALVSEGFVSGGRTAQLQLHGFADRRDPADVVLSCGVAVEGPLFAAVAAALVGTGERVRFGTEPEFADLAGRRNVQGRVAARHGAEFVHAELSSSLRGDPVRRSAVVSALGDAVQQWRMADTGRRRGRAQGSGP